MTSYKDYRLDQLGIDSQDEADELEHALDIRFDQFTHTDRKDWVEQNAYLEAYAQTGVISDAAAEAHVTIRTAQTWTYLDVLGFRNRLEIAEAPLLRRHPTPSPRTRKGTQRTRLTHNRPPPHAPAREIRRRRTRLRHPSTTPDPERHPLPIPPRRLQHQQDASHLSLEDIAAGAYPRTHHHLHLSSPPRRVLPRTQHLAPRTLLPPLRPPRPPRRVLPRTQHLAPRTLPPRPTTTTSPDPTTTSNPSTPTKSPASIPPPPRPPRRIPPFALSLSKGRTRQPAP